MLIHGDLLHLSVNMIQQLILGVPMECVNAWRVMIVYLSGILSGSLMSSILYPQTGLCGASTGVFALYGAFFFRMYNVLNWRNITKNQFIKLAVLLCILMLPSCMSTKPISHVGHVFGAVAGFLVGFVLFESKDLKESVFLKRVKMISAFAFGGLIILPISMHIFLKNYFPT